MLLVPSVIYFGHALSSKLTSPTTTIPKNESFKLRVTSSPNTLMELERPGPKRRVGTTSKPHLRLLAGDECVNCNVYDLADSLLLQENRNQEGGRRGSPTM